MPDLNGKVAVVAGATRGAGRAIACELGAMGATVYCTGRSVRGKIATAGRTETIDETAEMVTARGGTGIAVQTDHTVEAQVQALFEQVRREQEQLDILVNDVWGGDALTEWGKTFWQHSLADGLLMQERAVVSHMITSYYGTPLILKAGSGVIFEITDGTSTQYRGNLYYDLVKSSVIRLAYAMSEELRDHNVAVLAVSPGFLRSEAMLDHFGVTEATWRDAIKQDPHFAASETPTYLGRTIAALAADPNILARSGQALFTGRELAQHYNFTDADDTQPDWQAYYAGIVKSQGGSQ